MPGTTEFFARYPNDVFVETGTWHGDGVQAALDAGFEHVVSIELSPDLYARAQARFYGDPRVQLVEGSSDDVLPVILAELPGRRITFWLDAHWSGGDTVMGDRMSPILQELAAIATHPVKTHTILIDDVRLFGPPDRHQFPDDFGVTQDELMAALRTINPDYAIGVVTGTPQYPNDVLEALPPHE